MKKYMMMINLLILLSISGCGTIYGVAVDERSSSAMITDKRISTAILTGLHEDHEIKAFDISVYCYNGDVFLVGEYEKVTPEERAIKIARDIEGVKSVKAYFLPKKKGDTCGTSDNLAIRGKIAAKLIADKDIRSTNIEIKVIQCNVIFLGIVKSNMEIDKTVIHAQSVEGVRSVTSYIKATH